MCVNARDRERTGDKESVLASVYSFVCAGVFVCNLCASTNQLMSKYNVEMRKIKPNFSEIRLGRTH